MKVLALTLEFMARVAIFTTVTALAIRAATERQKPVQADRGFNSAANRVPQHPAD